MSASQIFAGLALITGLAVACQVLAGSLHIPAIILLLPAGFAAGAVTMVVDPDKISGAAFPPLVSLAVAIILFDGGLDLAIKGLEGDSRRVVRRLRGWGIPMTWAAAGILGGLLLGLCWKAALMLGAILIVSGPTVVTPILAAARPGKRLTTILGYEGTTIDPIGAIIAVVVFQALTVSHAHHAAAGVLGFAGRISLGVAGGAAGIAVVWLLLRKLKLTGILATEAVIATVITVAGFCALHLDLGHSDPGVPAGGDLAHGGLVALVVLLVLLVRPAVAVVATARTSLARNELIFVGAMDPRGIVAASTAASFTAPLVALHIAGASKLLAAMFLVIVGTVAIYGLAATPFARKLGLRQPETGDSRTGQPSSACPGTDGLPNSRNDLSGGGMPSRGSSKCRGTDRVDPGCCWRRGRGASSASLRSAW